MVSNNCTFAFQAQRFPTQEGQCAAAYSLSAGKCAGRTQPDPGRKIPYPTPPAPIRQPNRTRLRQKQKRRQPRNQAQRHQRHLPLLYACRRSTPRRANVGKYFAHSPSAGRGQGNGSTALAKRLPLRIIRTSTAGLPACRFGTRGQVRKQAAHPESGSAGVPARHPIMKTAPVVPERFLHGGVSPYGSFAWQIKIAMRQYCGFNQL